MAKAFVGSNLVIGIIVGLEGLLAMWLPLLAGAWSDRLRTRIGGRLPFLIAAAPVVVAGLVVMAAVGSIAAMAVAALVFFVGYFLAYEPYRALYPDAVGRDIAGRAQGTQALFRGTGTGLALFGGGLLLALGDGVPFLAAAIAYVVGMVVFGGALARRGVPEQEYDGDRSLRDAVSDVLQLVRGRPALQAFLAANALWELSLAGLKTFAFLYVNVGLGLSRLATTGVIGGVAVIVLLAALASGKLADRYGNLRILSLSLPIYGLGFLVPFASSSHLLVAVSIPLVAIGGGVIMALPYAVLMPLMPDEAHGALTGYYSLSRGIGTWLGPLLAGLAITAGSSVFSATHGYQAMWGVCATAVLLSIIPLRRLRDHTRDRRQAPRRRSR